MRTRSALTRRGMLGLGAGAAAAVGLSGCGTLTPSDGSAHGSGSNGGGSSKPSHPARPIGDGSTSFTGHFCSGYGTVGNWTPAQWRSEIQQAKAFVKEWRTNTGWSDLPSLPFDYEKELVGGRTPCLLGQNNLLPTAKGLGWRYDASSPGGRQVWPQKKLGIWDLPLQQIPFPGRSFEVLSMDYNMLANQSVNSTKPP